ncbi:MAG: DUF1045 domain-containing protein, partial [Brachymonas sp.]|nr:DUF1045 domain-containing protein [Brachymonas sp.]
HPMHRYAVYAAPSASSPLWQRGCTWLGRDPATGARLRNPFADAVLAGESLVHYLSDPMRYGFHATLKAPFTLRADLGFDDLHRTVTMLAQQLTAPPPFELAVRSMAPSEYLALVPAHKVPEIGTVAAHCVQQLHALAEPLSAEALATRRTKSQLDAREDELLQRWGYPYVLDRFRLHFTLSNGLAGTAPEISGEIIRLAQRHFGDPVVCKRFDLAIYGEPTPGADFVLLARCPMQRT